MPTLLLRRQDTFDGNDTYDYHSDWNDWVRWLILGLIIVGGCLIFVGFSCVSARRRRRAGFNAYPMTGWALGRTPPGHAPPQYYNNNQPQPAPPYTAAADTTTPYYQPPPQYNAEPAKEFAEAYAPPAGPPPAHTRPAGQ